MGVELRRRYVIMPTELDFATNVLVCTVCGKENCRSRTVEVLVHRRGFGGRSKLVPPKLLPFPDRLPHTVSFELFQQCHTQLKFTFTQTQSEVPFTFFSQLPQYAFNVELEQINKHTRFYCT